MPMLATLKAQHNLLLKQIEAEQERMTSERARLLL